MVIQVLVILMPYCTCSWLWQILQCLFYIFLSFRRPLNLFFVCISHNWNQNKVNIFFKSLFLLIFRYYFLIVCLFFAFSHPSWQPLLIKNLKNRSQVATQYVKLLESCQLCFFIIIYLVVTEDLQRNVFFKVFSL